MFTECEEGDRLCLLFESHLREWGWFDAFSKAIELIPVGLPKLSEFQKQEKLAESALYAARHACVEHITHCLICGGLRASGAVTKIMESSRDRIRSLRCCKRKLKPASNKFLLI